MTEVIEKIDAFIGKYPEHKEEVEGFYELYLDEVANGESEEHERELLLGAIEDLIK